MNFRNVVSKLFGRSAEEEPEAEEASRVISAELEGDIEIPRIFSGLGMSSNDKNTVSSITETLTNNGILDKKSNFLDDDSVIEKMSLDILMMSNQPTVSNRDRGDESDLKLVRKLSKDSGSETLANEEPPDFLAPDSETIATYIKNRLHNNTRKADNEDW